MSTNAVRSLPWREQVAERLRSIVSSDRTGNLVAVAIAVYGDCGLPLTYLLRGELADGPIVLGEPVPMLALLVTNGVVAQLLWWRLRRPITVFVLVVAYALAVALLIDDEAVGATLLVALYTVASRRSRRAAVAGCVLVWAYVVGVGLVQGSNQGEPFHPGLLANAALPSGAVTVLGRLVRALRVRGGELRQRAMRRDEIIRNERQRLARELHDTVAHSLSGILILAAGSRTATGGDHLQDLRSIEAASGQALRELGRMLTVLRASGGAGSDADLGQETLEDVDILIHRTRSCGVRVDVAVTGTPGRLDPSIDHAAYRTVQECLANVIKHGGGEATAQVRLDWTDESVIIEVRNAVGNHDHVIPSGFGLRGIRERVDLVGGRFTADRLDTAQFRVRVVLPRTESVAPMSVKRFRR